MIFIKTFFSPFKPLKWKWHLGKVKVGTPIFMPRTWKKATPKKAREEALKEIERIRIHNLKEGSYKLTEHTFDELYERYLRYRFPQPKKIGFDLRDVDWKTKWCEKDIRFQFSPVFSFVLFGLQFAIVFVAPEPDHYWPSFIYYHLHTDKTKSKEERLKQCREEFPNTWTRHYQDKTETIHYYRLILKKKYVIEDN